MSKNFEFVLNEAGVRELMQSGEMAAVVTSMGNGVASRAGSGEDFVAKAVSHKDRTVCYIQAITKEAKKDCLSSNTLIKALWG